MGKTAHDVVQGLSGLSLDAARKVDEAPTGVTPGYSRLLGGAVLANGKLRHVSDGLSPIIFLAQYELDTDTTRTAGSTTRINFDVPVSDPNGYVTIGGSWHFAPPADGLYRFTVSSIVIPSAAFAAGEKLYMQLWPDAGGTGIMTLAYQEFGITETGTRDQILMQGSVTRPCLTTDAVHVRFGNGTGNSVDQQGNNVEPLSTMITIEWLT